MAAQPWSAPESRDVRVAQRDMDDPGLGVEVQAVRAAFAAEASAGASFQVSSMNGVFHGVIRPATPAGERIT